MSGILRPRLCRVFGGWRTFAGGEVDVAVFDADIVGKDGSGGGAAERDAGGEVEAGAVVRAGHRHAFDDAVGERPVGVRATVGDGEDAGLGVEEGDLLALVVDGPGGAGREVGEGGDTGPPPLILRYLRMSGALLRAGALSHTGWGGRGQGVQGFAEGEGDAGEDGGVAKG